MQGLLAWPVAKLLELTLGPHHGIIYRRAELKELIAMHSNGGELGGDLKTDTVTIIGGALDLQEKVSTIVSTADALAHRRTTAGRKASNDSDQGRVHAQHRC